MEGAWLWKAPQIFTLMIYSTCGSCSVYKLRVHKPFLSFFFSGSSTLMNFSGWNCLSCVGAHLYLSMADFHVLSRNGPTLHLQFLTYQFDTRNHCILADIHMYSWEHASYMFHHFHKDFARTDWWLHFGKIQIAAQSLIIQTIHAQKWLIKKYW